MQVSDQNRPSRVSNSAPNAPILRPSQLSRQVEQPDDKRPQLSSLRESGSIEEDFDVVMFVYREEYYLKNKEPRPGADEHMEWMGQMERAHGRAEVMIGKQRHGRNCSSRRS